MELEVRIEINGRRPCLLGVTFDGGDISVDKIILAEDNPAGTVDALNHFAAVTRVKCVVVRRDDPAHEPVAAVESWPPDPLVYSFALVPSDWSAYVDDAQWHYAPRTLSPYTVKAMSKGRAIVLVALDSVASVVRGRLVATLHSIIGGFDGGRWAEMAKPSLPNLAWYMTLKRDAVGDCGYDVLHIESVTTAAVGADDDALVVCRLLLHRLMHFVRGAGRELGLSLISCSDNGIDVTAQRLLRDTLAFTPLPELERVRALTEEMRRVFGGGENAPPFDPWAAAVKRLVARHRALMGDLVANEDVRTILAYTGGGLGPAVLDLLGSGIQLRLEKLMDDIAQRFAGLVPALGLGPASTVSSCLYVGQKSMPIKLDALWPQNAARDRLRQLETAEKEAAERLITVMSQLRLSEQRLEKL